MINISSHSCFFFFVVVIVVVVVSLADFEFNGFQEMRVLSLLARVAL